MIVQSRWRPRMMAAILATGIAITGVAQAAGFDEKLKAPTMREVSELRSQAVGFAARHGEIRTAAPDQLIRDTALASRKFDLIWQIQRAIDERKPLQDFAQLGIVSRGDGSYSVDMGEHPEWYDLHETMAGMLMREDLDALGPALIARGFRPQDVTILKDYVASNNPAKASANEVASVAIGFSRAIRTLDRIRRPVPENTITSYFYQRARAASESDRHWVEGLLQRLDAQRGRILVSIFTEMKATAVWSPEDWSETAAAFITQARQPGFEARVAAEAKEVAP
jgi:hypothetical protein